MGLDFIRKAAGSFKKQWNEGAERLAERDLYGEYPECATRSLVLDISHDAAVNKSECLLLRCENDGSLAAYRECEQLAVARDAPMDLVNAIKSRGGYAFGEVERVHKRARAIRLKVKG